MDLQSPFINENNTIILYSEPILDPYQNIYLNVLTLSGIPKGPLSKMTKQIKVPNLSSFQTFSSSIMNPFPNCIYILTRYPNNNQIQIQNQWMFEDDIPSVLSYLQNYNYKIETSLLNHSQKYCSGNRKQICVFSYK